MIFLLFWPEKETFSHASEKIRPFSVYVFPRFSDKEKKAAEAALFFYRFSPVVISFSSRERKSREIHHSPANATTT